MRGLGFRVWGLRFWALGEGGFGGIAARHFTLKGAGALALGSVPYHVFRFPSFVYAMYQTHVKYPTKRVGYRGLGRGI